MNGMKRYITLFLAMAVAVSIFAGCGGGGQSSAGAASSSSGAGGAPSGQAASSESGAPAAPVDMSWDSPELTWRQDTSPVTYSLFLDIAWAPMDVWGSDHVSQKVTELTGVSFDVTKRQDAQHLDVVMASGEYPDSIFVFTNKFKYENPAISQPWNELIPQYAPEFMELIDPSEIEMAIADDGNFYTLYTHTRNEAYWADPEQPVSYGEADLMFRDDVMAAIGNPGLETMDDMYNALKLCKEQFPDYTPYLETIANPTALMGWFGVTLGFSDFIVNNGKLDLIMLAKQDELREMFAFKNKLVREGLMSVEGLSYDFEKQKQAILAGKVFSTAAQIYDVDLFNEELDKLDGNTLRYTALDKPLTVNGEMRYAPVDANPGFAGFYITTACKEPGRLIALMEFMKSPEGDRLTQWGVEGVDFDYNEEGLPIINNDIPWKERGDNVWYFGASFGVEVQKALVRADERYAQVSKLMFDFKPYWSQDAALSRCTPLPETPEAEINSMLKLLRENKFNEVITAKDDAAFEAKFAELYAEIDKMDIDGYLSWAQAKYDSAK